METPEGERLFTENEILDVAEEHMNEIAVHNLMKTGLFGEIAVGMSICICHIIDDLRLHSKRAGQIEDQLQTSVIGKVHSSGEKQLDIPGALRLVPAGDGGTGRP